MGRRPPPDALRMVMATYSFKQLEDPFGGKIQGTVDQSSSPDGGRGPMEPDATRKENAWNASRRPEALEGMEVLQPLAVLLCK